MLPRTRPGSSVSGLANDTVGVAEEQSTLRHANTNVHSRTNTPAIHRVLRWLSVPADGNAGVGPVE